MKTDLVEPRGTKAHRSSNVLEQDDFDNDLSDFYDGDPSYDYELRKDDQPVGNVHYIWSRAPN